MVGLGWVVINICPEFLDQFNYLLFASIGCGMRLRSDDPATMKSFIVSIQNKVTELKAASEDSQGNTRSKRVHISLYFAIISADFSFLCNFVYFMCGRWSSCLKPYSISRTTKRRLKRTPYNIPASKSGFKRSLYFPFFFNNTRTIITLKN